MVFLPEKAQLLRLFLSIAGLIILIGIAYYFGTAFSSMKGAEMPQQVNLADVKVAYVPETEEVVILDRKSNIVKYVLSKEVTTAVFTLKSSSIQQDFLNATDKTKSAPNKGAPKQPLK